MVQSACMALDPDELDALDEAILDYFVEDREAGDQPWGKATPTEVFRALEDRGVLDELNKPVRVTIQNRIQRLAVGDHLENVYDTGCYRFVSDPRADND